MRVASSEKRRRIHRVNVRARRIEEDRKEVGRKREKREVKEVTREGESERRKGGDEIDGTRWNWAPGGADTVEAPSSNSRQPKTVERLRVGVLWLTRCRRRVTGFFGTPTTVATDETCTSAVPPAYGESGRRSRYPANTTAPSVVMAVEQVEAEMGIV